MRTCILTTRCAREMHIRVWRIHSGSNFNILEVRTRVVVINDSHLTSSMQNPQFHSPSALSSSETRYIHRRTIGRSSKSRSLGHHSNELFLADSMLRICLLSEGRQVGGGCPKHSSKQNDLRFGDRCRAFIWTASRPQINCFHPDIIFTECPVQGRPFCRHYMLPTILNEYIDCAHQGIRE